MMCGDRLEQVGNNRVGFVRKGMGSLPKRMTPILAAILVLLMLGGPGLAQVTRNSPRIGYVFPAGGQIGSTFEVTIGGQYLEGVDKVLVNHPGIEFRVVDYSRPLTQREVNDLMQKLQAVREKVQELLRSQPGQARFGTQALFQKVAQEMGVTREQIRALEEYRRIRMDPKRQPNPQIAERVVAEVAVAADVPPGQYHIRVKSRNGVSNPIIFQVDVWPEAVETEPNDREPMSLEGLPGPLIVNGQIMPGDVDRFQLPLRKGQKIVFALAGRAITPYLADAVPGWFQAVLSLSDPQGRQVAFADDWRFHPDPVLLFEAPQDGLYTVTVTDAIYRGREDFVYRLLVGEVAFVTGIFPLGGQVGKKVRVELAGWNLPQSSLEVDLTEGGLGIRPLQLFQWGGHWNRLPFVADRLPDIQEAEPNDSLGTAQRIMGEGIVNGKISSPSDTDVFRIDVKAGEEWVAEVVARRLGSPLDSVVRVLDLEGNVLASNDDFDDKTAGLITHQADSYVRVKASKSGPIFVQLADIQRQGGEEFAYRLRISRPQPDFAVRFAPSTLNVNPGVPVLINVWVVRKDGFEGDIFLELKDSPSGWRLSGNWVPSGQEHIVMTLSVGGGVSAGEYPLKVVARAEWDGKIIEHEAVACDDLMQAFFYRHLVPADQGLVSVAPVRRFFSPAWGFNAATPVKIPAGGTGEVRLPDVRGALGQGVKLQLRDAPEGLSLGELRQGFMGMVLEVKADAEKVQPGLRGNLLVEVLMERSARGMPSRLVPVAILPAIPFEIVKPADNL
jgi:hypothetical protein